MTVRVVITLSDQWDYDLWVPDAKYMTDSWLKASYPHVYDVPDEVAGKYDRLMQLRDEVQEELTGIVRGKKGQVQLPSSSEGLPF